MLWKYCAGCTPAPTRMARNVNRSALGENMEIHIVTLFPSMFTGIFTESIVGRAQKKGVVQITFHDPRTFTIDRHRMVDDAPFGGGPGMILKAPPLTEAVLYAANHSAYSPHVILMSPQGVPLTQAKAESLTDNPAITIVCGHYGGVDERFVQLCVDEEISIGDYVLTGGEIPAMVLTDAIVRLLPNAIGNADSAGADSFSSKIKGFLQYPQYTRPAEYKGLRVPDVLLSGDHRSIAEWRNQQSKERTCMKRPELLNLDNDPLDEQQLESI